MVKLFILFTGDVVSATPESENTESSTSLLTTNSQFQRQDAATTTSNTGTMDVVDKYLSFAKIR